MRERPKGIVSRGQGWHDAVQAKRDFHLHESYKNAINAALQQACNMDLTVPLCETVLKLREDLK